MSDDMPSISELQAMSEILAKLAPATPILLEIVAAALAWQATTCDLQSCDTDDYTVAVMQGECAGDTHHESCAVARHIARLIDALAKVRR